MKRLTSTYELRLLIGMMFIILADWALSSSTASAGCGDYVTVGGLSMTSHAQEHAVDDAFLLDLLRNGGVLPDAGAIRFGRIPLNLFVDSAPSNRRLPCSGPSCSNGTPARDIPLPQVNSTQERWGVVELVPSATNVGIVGADPQEDQVASPGPASAVYHPPR